MKLDPFLEMESKYNLINDAVEGMQYWNLCRFDIFQYRILEKKLNLSPAHSGEKSGFTERLRHKIMLQIYSWLYGRVPRSRVDVCFINHPRRVKNDKYYECVYTEKLAKVFPYSAVIEKPYLNGHLRPIQTKNIVYTDIISVKALKQLKKIKKTAYYQSVREQIQMRLEAPLKELSVAYEIEINIDRTIDFCTEKTVLSYLKREHFLEWLNIIQPKVIVETVYYNRDCMMINDAAKELRIPVVELQHGTMGKLHNAYQFSEGVVLRQLPDKILTFSQFWIDIARVPDKSKRMEAVGFPYFEEQIQKYKRKKNDIYTVIFVSQGTVGEQLSKLAVAFAKENKTAMRILYKLHPSEYGRWKEQYSWLQEETIEVIDNNEKSIYELFSWCDAQVGVYSTAIYEGMAFGLKTCIYDMAMADTMYELCDSGYATLIRNIEELSEVLQSEENGNVSKQTFWETDALKKIENVIENYLH